MTRNRELFVRDPITTTIPNLGVTKVGEPERPEEWDVLRYELTSFVCEGEYHRGLERILSTYLGHLGQAQQPAVWVSGFYGSGKSHLVRVLEYLWRDVRFPDGATARDLTTLPDDIAVLLRELSTAGRQAGGLWSAAGMLSAGAGDNVRMALLSILFRSARLPTAYAPARFAIWLKNEGFYDGFAASIRARGRDLDHELSNLYVSPHVADALLQVYPDFAPDVAEARRTLRAQFPQPDEISDDEMLRVMEDVLLLQSTAAGRLPRTLIVLDEMQQFLRDDPGRTLAVQNIVEICSSRFGANILFVATGQAALGSTPQLEKLQGRFRVLVMLSDTDVERVVREVVLRKKPDMVPRLRDTLQRVSGEIDRQLIGTAISASHGDHEDLVPDYPLLPTRRRFWERTIRTMDSAGKAGQLRTQLLIVHNTTRAVAEEAVGHVVPGDAIFDELSPHMQQSSVLLREVAETIGGLNDGTADGRLAARLAKLIFLIGKLPQDGPAATGLRARPEILADLLVDDLIAGSATLRQRIPVVLERLVEQGTLMLVDDEYRLQTREGAEWEGEYRRRLSGVRSDDGRIASVRATELRGAIAAELRGITLTQGSSRVPRKYGLHFGDQRPSNAGSDIPIWVRDGWDTSEAAVRGEARAAGVGSPIVFVFLPRPAGDDLRHAIASAAAAGDTLEARGTPDTDEGREAFEAMRSRLGIEQSKLAAQVRQVLAAARVFQGGGSEVVEASPREAIEAALRAALDRQFPEFGAGDHASWGIALSRATDGNDDPLSVVGWTAGPESNPVCQAVLRFVGQAGKTGREVRAQFTAPPMGWPQDAIDAALATLLSAGLIEARRDGSALAARGLQRTQIPGTTFSSESQPVAALQKIALRQLLTQMEVSFTQGGEIEQMPALLRKALAAAERAGGEPPLPAPPAAEAIRELLGQTGNRQAIAVYEARQQILDRYREWTQRAELAEARLRTWRQLQRLVVHARTLPVHQEVAPQVEAILAHRALLDEPDPVTPILRAVADALRSAVQAERERFAAAQQRGCRALAQLDGWERVADAERAHILAGADLVETPTVAVGSLDALLETLDATPLDWWADKIAAVDGRVARAREQVARLLQPEAERVPIPTRLLTTEAEVERYLEDLRGHIMRRIREGRPVILG